MHGTVSVGTLVVGTNDRNKKAGIPPTTGIPATIQADYTGNFGLELRRRSADELSELHRRAAQWFADHGDVVEAVRHRLAAGDWTDAARLVADHSFRWVLDGQAGTIDAVLQAFPEGASADHPDLALAHAAADVNQGRLEEAAAQLALAE